MCLGIPGRLVEIHKQDDLPMGKVEFGGIRKEVLPGVHARGPGGRLRAGSRRLRHQPHR